MNRRHKWLSVALCILCALMLMLPEVVDAALEKPTINEGDYWNYEMSGEYGTWSFEGTVHDKITGETTIIVDGQSYEVWGIQQ